MPLIRSTLGHPVTAGISVVVNGRFFQHGLYRGTPSLLALEPQGASPFQLVSALPLPGLRHLAVAGQKAIIKGIGWLSVVDISDAKIGRAHRLNSSH